MHIYKIIDSGIEWENYTADTSIRLNIGIIKEYADTF